MYATALVTPPTMSPAWRRDPSPWDLEKQARAAARALVAKNQKLNLEQRVTAELAAQDQADKLAARGIRRRAEQELADFIQYKVLPIHADPKLEEIPHKLRACRCHGTLARTAEGKVLTLWDTKCGLNRLCPDESRNETHRLIERFAPAAEAYLRLHPRARLYSAVFTLPNFPDGKLRSGLLDIYRRFNRLRKKKENKKLVFHEILGSVAVVEAPRSAHGDWNVHLNALLLTDGYLGYSKLRRHWFWNVEIKRVEGNTAQIVRALKEIIKYAVQITPTKSQEKSEQGKTHAPAMTEWEPSAWFEWYRAHNRYRRVRSYGKLFLNEKRREELELPPDEARSISNDKLEILGRVSFFEGAYRVTLSDLDLIREDNSLPAARKFGGVEATTHPPPPPATGSYIKN